MYHITILHHNVLRAPCSFSWLIEKEKTAPRPVIYAGGMTNISPVQSGVEVATPRITGRYTQHNHCSIYVAYK